MFFNNGLSVKLNIKVGLIKKKIKPVHQLKIFADKKNYILETKLNSLSDKFQLFEFNKNSNKAKKKGLSFVAHASITHSNSISIKYTTYSRKDTGH